VSGVSPQRIETLVRKLESSGDAATQTAARELVQALLDLHGTGLLRVMALVDQSGEPGARLIEQFGQDPAVSRLLLLHDLHPQDFATRVRQAIERLSGALRRQGASVELVSVDEAGVVTVRAVASGLQGCGSTAADLRRAIEDGVYESAPESIAVVVEGLQEPGAPAAFVSLDSLRIHHQAQTV
jgi:Fe-S cluster biogenesis protein NfuA